jgi:hypothetical protein
MHIEKHIPNFPNQGRKKISSRLKLLTERIIFAETCIERGGKDYIETYLLVKVKDKWKILNTISLKCKEVS